MRRLCLCVLLLAGCGDDAVDLGDAGDAGDAASEVSVDAADAAPEIGEPDEGGPPSTDHCNYAPLPPTARAGGVVESGLLEAGAAEVFLSVPVGIALGAYSARAEIAGNQGRVDERPTSGFFAASTGIETRLQAKAIALRAGGETVLIVKADLGLGADDLLYNLEERLGPEFAGKVLLAVSHSHAAVAQYSHNSTLALGLGLRDPLSYGRLIDDLEIACRDAIGALEPATVALGYNPDFDLENLISSDRRIENDGLAGGAEKDHHLYALRIDRPDGSPIAMAFVFGVHPTVLGPDNDLTSTEVTGAIERRLEERFAD
ncbi:MAG: hypothetical protein AAF645_28795, partial [Myxococcota bacterium]